MSKIKSLLLSALVGIQPALAQADKQSVSLAPIAAPQVIPTHSQHVKRQVIRQAAQNAYPRTHYQRALYFKQKGDINRALIEFLKSTQENPRLVKAFYEQALIFRQRGYLKLSESSLEQALAVDSSYQQARLLLAEIRLEQGNVTDAVKELSRSLGLRAEQAAPPAQNLGATTGQPDSHAMGDQPPSTLPSATQASAAATPVTSSDPQLEDILKGIPGIDPSVPVGSPPQPDKQDSISKEPAASMLEQSTLPAPPPEKQEGKNTKAQHVRAFHLPRPHRLSWLSREKHSQPPSKPKKLKPQSLVKTVKEKRPSWLSRLFGPKQEDAPHSISDQSGKNSPATVLHPGSDQPTKMVLHQSPPNVSADATHSRSSESTNLALTLHGSQEENESQEMKPEANIVFTPSTVKTAPTPEKAAQASAEPVQPTTTPHIASATAATASVMTKAPTASTHPNNVRTQSAVIPAIPKPGSPAYQRLPQLQAQKPLMALQIPSLPNFNSGLLAAANTKAKTSRPTSSHMVKTDPKTANSDPWTERLQYLADNGTTSLKPGEAFMFSEESGDATLFLPNGRLIRRHIAPPRNPEDVVLQRRPDILAPKELMYNLSLLGRLLPKQSEEPPKTDTDSPFNLDHLMSKPDGFWGWLKQRIKI